MPALQDLRQALHAICVCAATRMDVRSRTLDTEPASVPALRDLRQALHAIHVLAATRTDVQSRTRACNHQPHRMLGTLTPSSLKNPDQSNTLPSRGKHQSKPRICRTRDLSMQVLDGAVSALEADAGSLSAADLYKRVLPLSGMGPFTAANVLQLLGMH